METTHSSTNKQSILSLVFGVLTIAFLCASMIPFPFTGFICFPLSFLFGVLALTFGLVSLNQIRQRNETGRPMAWIGIMAGGFILMCVLCMVIAIAALFIFSPNSIHLPPYIQNFQV
ncbi:MAG: DUF4190 domain-containing protein [Chloroflexi bacterium]|nr:DUF4190 domain-containing protein [Chloroflexota bacterium]